MGEEIREVVLVTGRAAESAVEEEDRREERASCGRGVQEFEATGGSREEGAGCTLRRRLRNGWI